MIVTIMIMCITFLIHRKLEIVGNLHTWNLMFYYRTMCTRNHGEIPDHLKVEKIKIRTSRGSPGVHKTDQKTVNPQHGARRTERKCPKEQHTGLTNENSNRKNRESNVLDTLTKVLHLNDTLTAWLFIFDHFSD